MRTSCTLFFAGILFAGSGLVTAHAVPSLTGNTVTPQRRAAPEFYQNQKAWALATTAILMEVNDQRHDILGGKFESVETVDSLKRMLSNWWDINSRKDLIRALRWLGETGHRTDFDETGEMLYSLTPEEITTCMVNAQHDPETYHQLELVRDYYPRVGEKSLLAWDFSRYIALCRWGYLVGYITEEEAWEKIMPAARILRTHFSSWQEFGENYLLGREYWSYERTMANGKEYRQVFSRLLNDPASPWNVCPWNTDLEKVRMVQGSQRASVSD